MIFRILNALMVPLFALAVAVQYNDPDPVRWMAIYGAALVVSLVAAVRGRIALWVPLVVAAIAVTWSVYWAHTSLATAETYTHMFDHWEMRNDQIEEAREASGLMIVTFWMAVVALGSWVRSRGRVAEARPSRV